MGQLLQKYIESNVPALENIVLGQPQKRGAGTFPGGEREPLSPITPVGPGGQPTGSPEAAFGPQPQPGPAPAPSFDTSGQPPEVQAFPPEQKPPDMGGENSFSELAKKHDETDINAAIDAVEGQGVKLDDAYQKATGSPPEKGMSRKEKGLILLEFGLNLMAQSGTGEGTLGGDIGLAGTAALKGHVGRETLDVERKRQAQIDALERRRKEAQIKRSEAAQTVVKTDADGNLMVINKDTQQATPVLMDGEPVKGDQTEMFATQVDRLAYEGEFCEGLSGNAASACRKRALAYAKGVREVAFPQVLRADQTDRVMKWLEDPDNASAKYMINGVPTRWKNMNPDQQTEVASNLVDRRIAVINSGNVTSNRKKSEKVQTFGLPQSEIDTMKPGKIYTLSDGKKVRKRDGKLEEVK